MLGDVLRAFSAASRPFLLGRTLSDCDGGSCCRTPWPSDVFAVCAVSRECYFSGTTLNFKFAAKRRKPQKHGHLSLPASRGRAPAAICNNQQSSHDSWTLHNKQNAETRDLGLKTHGEGRDLSDPEHPLRIDILVDDTVVVECKAGAYNPVYAAQCLTYLRLKKLKTGLVINFGLPKLVDGVERVSN